MEFQSKGICRGYCKSKELCRGKPKGGESLCCEVEKK